MLPQAHLTKPMNRTEGKTTAAQQEFTATELAETERKRLLRASLCVVAAAAAAFAVFRITTEDFGLVGVHIAIVISCLLGQWRVLTVVDVTPWATGFLVAVYSCLIFFIEYPGTASDATFAWSYLMPVGSYLLLGRRLGFAVAAPFMAVVAGFGLARLWPIDSTANWLFAMDATAVGALALVFMHYYETSRAKDRAALELLAHTDSLTGLANRRSFMSGLQRTCREASRDGTEFAFAIIDIDHFKQVNDDLGHDVGDYVLKRVAGYLSEWFRQTDRVGRLGGEEFGLILRNTDTHASRQLLDDLRRYIAAQTIKFENNDISITITSGIAYWPHEADSANELYRIADRQLYEGKRRGRNTTISGSPQAPPTTAGAYTPAD